MAKRRLTETRDRDVTVAWLTAALTRAKTLPKLETLMARKREAQTPSEQRMALQMIFGERKRQQQAAKERR